MTIPFVMGYKIFRHLGKDDIDLKRSFKIWIFFEKHFNIFLQQLHVGIAKIHQLQCNIIGIVIFKENYCTLLLQFGNFEMGHVEVDLEQILTSRQPRPSLFWSRLFWQMENILPGKKSFYAEWLVQFGRLFSWHLQKLSLPWQKNWKKQTPQK
jgi:hypothetical protein